VSVLARLTDRVRPWVAPPPPPDAPTVAVIGGGPAGLATAALLRRSGLRSVVVDRRSSVGGSWPDRYDSLRLNTVRWMSDLPGQRMPRSTGRWVRRDDIAAYLRGYADAHGLELRPGCEAGRLERSADGWSILLDGTPTWFAGVVVATGGARTPVVPDWDGSDGFTGRLLHSSGYRRPADHAGRRVLVVGAGSSGGEVCVDLAGAGVDVTWSVRSAPQVFPREVLRVPATPFAPVADVLPDRWLDRLGPWLERRLYGPRDYLPPPSAPMMELLARCKEPMTADGIVALVRSGRVRVVAALDSLTPDGAVLVDGTRVGCDDVIAATGYRPGLEPLVGHLGVLDRDGRPVALAPAAGLAFVGYRIPFTGTLWAIENDARLAARSIRRAVATGSQSERAAAP
jgi:cation diffusion facilitator CzcD-associated flavoprotein CzcO